MAAGARKGNPHGHGQADLVFRGGSIYTVDAARSWARAAAILDGRIVTVGSERDVAELIGPGTEVVDLKGRMLVPGFQDSHAHPLAGGLEQLRCDLTRAFDAEAYVRLIGEYGAANPDVPWILGGGWSMPAFPGGTPTKEAVDAVVSDRPVFLFNRDHHGAWVNSRALEMAGITRRTPNPADGRIERLPNGEPSGTLHEGAMSLVAAIAPAATEHDLHRGLLQAQRYMHSLGITGWQDAMVGVELVGSDIFEIYLAAAERGDLTARVVGSLWWRRDEDDKQVEEFVEKRARAAAGHGRFRAGTVKIMQDGVCEDFTASLLDPYLDADGHPTDNRGLSFIDAEALKAHVTRLDAEGFQVHVHALGDRAVRESLDAVQAARRANGWNDHRHHLAHIQVVHPEDIPRFRALGVTANAQPLWACMEPQMADLTIPFLGPERAGWQYPFGSLTGAGAMLACGSDWPVSSPNVLWGMHTAVNRTPSGDYAGEEGPADPQPFLPGEAIGLPAALAAYTMGSAYVNHMEGQTGSIEAGKLADLTVLDRNLFEHPTEEIGDARVDMTFVEGRKVFERTSA